MLLGSKWYSLNDIRLTRERKQVEYEENPSFFNDAELEILQEYKRRNHCIRSLQKNQVTIDFENRCCIGLEECTSDKLRVDVLSLGYQERLDFMKTQQETWGSHASVRSFWGLSESEHKCKEKMDVQKHFKFCERWHNDHSKAMEKFEKHLYDRSFLERKDNLSEWLCAQKRLVSGLARRLQTYGNESNEENKVTEYPDFLFIVEDDTYVNVELFDEFVRGKDPNVPMAFSGCRDQLVHPYGHISLILSRGSILRLTQRLHCDNVETTSEFEIKACQKLKENNLDEMNTFYPGASLIDIALAIASRENFCMLSGWLLKYFVDEYYVSEVYDEFSNLLPYQEKESCRHIGQCFIDSSLCFLQSKESLVATTTVFYSDWLHSLKMVDAFQSKQ